MRLTSFVPYSWSPKQIYRSAPLDGEEVKIEGAPMINGYGSALDLMFYSPHGAAVLDSVRVLRLSVVR